MSDILHAHPLWGKHAPLYSLTGAGLLILTTGRVAYAIMGCIAILWIYGASIFTLQVSKKIIPRKGRSLVIMCISSFYGTLWYVLLSLVSPIMAGELYLHIMMVPMVFMASGLWYRSFDTALDTSMSSCFLESLTLGGLMIALALVREPFGFGSISLPGREGITEYFGSPRAAAASIRFICSVSGGLILLGYLSALFYVTRKMYLRYLGQRDTP